jgi:type I restriction enzyme S subunit
MVVKPGYKQTDVGVIPEEWEIIRFSDLADKSIPWSIAGGPFGSNLKASDYTDEGVRIIQLQNIGDGRFHDEYAIYTSEEKADELLSNNIYPGEIILSKMGDPVARACFVPTVDRRYLMASDGIRLAVDSRRFNKRFVHDYINSVYFRKKAMEASTGSTRQRIGLVELKQLPFIAPPFEEQAAIAEVLSDMDAELAALEQRR